jgi:Epoxide hydrolase N terminus
MIVPFQIPSDPEGLSDLNRRLKATRWNDAVVPDWSYGMERGFLRKLVGYWSDRYDWAERRALLNRLPHFWATLDGYGLHFLHYRERGPNPVPLLLMNGWPIQLRRIPAPGCAPVARRAIVRRGGSHASGLRLLRSPDPALSDRACRSLSQADDRPRPRTVHGVGDRRRVRRRHADRPAPSGPCHRRPHLGHCGETSRRGAWRPPSVAERDYAARAEIQMAAAAGAEVIASVRNPSTPRSGRAGGGGESY